MMELRGWLLVLCVTIATGLRLPPPARSGGISRRRLLEQQVSLTGLATLSSLPLPAIAVEDDIERVISQSTLTAALTSAVPRDIVITGANSGVGLAGAKLLTAAGHRVTLACRTQAKADAAAAACMDYAATMPVRLRWPSSGVQV